MPSANSDTAPLMHAPAPDIRERLKLEGGKRFEMVTEFEPAGDQPTAIAELSQGVIYGEHDHVLMGDTGTGKT